MMSCPATDAVTASARAAASQHEDEALHVYAWACTETECSGVAIPPSPLYRTMGECLAGARDALLAFFRAKVEQDFADGDKHRLRASADADRSCYDLDESPRLSDAEIVTDAVARCFWDGVDWIDWHEHRRARYGGSPSQASLESRTYPFRYRPVPVTGFSFQPKWTGTNQSSCVVWAHESGDVVSGTWFIVRIRVPTADIVVR